MFEKPLGLITYSSHSLEGVDFRVPARFRSLPNCVHLVTMLLLLGISLTETVHMISKRCDNDENAFVLRQS